MITLSLLELLYILLSEFKLLGVYGGASIDVGSDFEEYYSAKAT